MMTKVNMNTPRAMVDMLELDASKCHEADCH